MAAKPIPDGYHSITPYLIVQGAEKALDFYSKAFGAQELFRFPGPGGKIVHAEFRIGDSTMMLSDENAEWRAFSPTHLGGTCVGILIYVEKCDDAFQRAVEAGAKVERPLQDQFYGDRSGTVIDPFGHKCTIATHIEDVSVEEVHRRFGAMGKSHPKPSGGADKH
jgi:PhnB protein